MLDLLQVSLAEKQANSTVSAARETCSKSNVVSPRFKMGVSDGGDGVLKLSGKNGKGDLFTSMDILTRRAARVISE